MKFESKYTRYRKYVKVKDKEILIQFENGIYETEDKEIIAQLKKDPNVRQVKEGK